MATLADLELSLVRASLAALGDISPREGNPVLDSWRRMTNNLVPVEARTLPFALARTIPVLGPNDERFRILLGVLTTFDIYETVPALLDYASRSRSFEATLAAATLAVSPGVPDTVVRQLLDLANARARDPIDVSAIAVRLSSLEHAPTPGLARLRRQIWPGLVDSRDDSLAPIVFVDEESDQPEVRWQLLGDLVESGAVVRRIPMTFAKDPLPRWIGSTCAVVSWTGERAISRLHPFAPLLTVNQLVDADKTGGARWLRRVDAALGGGRLRIPTGPTELTSDPLNRDSYRLGSFDVREMVFLTGTRLSTLQRLREELKPRDFNGIPYWSYNQLVALRTWEVWRRETGRTRLPTDVLRALVTWQGADQATEVAVTSKGQILVKKGAQFVDWQKGDVVLKDFLALDRVFDPQPLGGDRQAPGLPSPSPHTYVHPALQGGTPCVQGYRIAAKVLARLAEGKPRQIDAIRAVYPELEEPLIVDAIALGGRVLQAA